MNKKRIMLVILSIVFCISMFPATAMANTNYSNQDEYEYFWNFAQIVKIDADGSIELSLKKPTGRSINGYVIETEMRAKVIPLTEDAKSHIFAISSSRASNNREIADTSGTITLYSTTNWETKNAYKGPMKRLTGFSGRISGGGTGSILGGGVSVVSQSINYGAWGSGESGVVSGGTTITLSNSARSYSYSKTSSWIYESLPGEVGHTFSVGLKRGTSQWYTTLENNA